MGSPRGLRSNSASRTFSGYPGIHPAVIPIVGLAEFSTGDGEEPLRALAQPARVENSGGRPTLVAEHHAYFGYEFVIHSWEE